MLSILLTLILFTLSSSLHFQERIVWEPAGNFSASDRSFDEFFRNSIPALGDSVAKKFAHVNEYTIIQYLDETNNNGEVVAWEVEGKEENGKKIDRVIQIK